MARGVRRSVDERIEELDKKIAAKQKDIKALEDQRSQLISAKKNESALMIIQMAEEKGIELSQILANIESM